MAKIDLSAVALPQEELVVDDVVYMVTALPASKGLAFMEKYQSDLEKQGRPDLHVMKELICNSVTKDGKVIADKAGNGSISFDILFARKLKHLSNLFTAVVGYNFDDVFTDADGEE